MHTRTHMYPNTYLKTHICTNINLNARTCVRTRKLRYVIIVRSFEYWSNFGKLQHGLRMMLTIFMQEPSTFISLYWLHTELFFVLSLLIFFWLLLENTRLLITITYENWCKNVLEKCTDELDVSELDGKTTNFIRFMKIFDRYDRKQ